MWIIRGPLDNSVESALSRELAVVGIEISRLEISGFPLSMLPSLFSSQQTRFAKWFYFPKAALRFSFSSQKPRCGNFHAEENSNRRQSNRRILLGSLMDAIIAGGDCSLRPVSSSRWKMNSDRADEVEDRGEPRNS